MKKFLCVLMMFALCFSVCAAAEENADEEAVSNIVTYGPLTFDTHGEWIEYNHIMVDDYLYGILGSIHDPYYSIGFHVQDIWNDLMPDESRLKLEAKGITQDDYNNIEMARAYLVDRANEVGANPDNIVILEIGNYPYAYMDVPFEVDYGDGLVVIHNAPTYYTIINGYLIKLFLIGGEDSAFHNSFIDTLNTVSIGIVDSLNEN